MNPFVVFAFLLAVCGSTLRGQDGNVSQDQFQKLQQQLLTIQKQMVDMQKQHAAEIKALKDEVRALRQQQPATGAADEDELAALRRLAEAEAGVRQDPPNVKSVGNRPFVPRRVQYRHVPSNQHPVERPA